MAENLSWAAAGAGNIGGVDARDGVGGLASSGTPTAHVRPGAPMRLAELQQLAPQLHELLARHGASNPAVFGSVARDQALPGVRRHRKLSQRRHQN